MGQPWFHCNTSHFLFTPSSHTCFILPVTFLPFAKCLAPFSAFHYPLFPYCFPSHLPYYHVYMSKRLLPSPLPHCTTQPACPMSPSTPEESRGRDRGGREREERWRLGGLSCHVTRQVASSLLPPPPGQQQQGWGMPATS